MDVFQEASDVLRAWKRESHLSLFEEKAVGLGVQDEHSTTTSGSWDSHAGGLLNNITTCNSKLLNDALSGELDWDSLHRGAGQADCLGNLDRDSSSLDWMDSSKWDHQLPPAVENVPRPEVVASTCTEPPTRGVPSRWQLLASYTERGQVPPPQLLTLEEGHEVKPYNPAQYAEAFHSTSSQRSGLERKTQASAARQTTVSTPDIRRRQQPVPAYDPRPVMEVRHQMVADKRKKRALQKADVIAQGRAALAEARGAAAPPKAAHCGSEPTSPPVKADMIDNRLIAYQKRKLAVQAEQQRLEVEVQQLRQQIREDAEKHRKGRQDRLHECENAAPFTERENPSHVASPCEDLEGGNGRQPHTLPRGTLTERKHSNSELPERTRSASRSREAVRADKGEQRAAERMTAATSKAKEETEIAMSCRERSESSHAKRIALAKRPVHEAGAQKGDGAGSSGSLASALVSADQDAATSVQVGYSHVLFQETTTVHDELVEEVSADFSDRLEGGDSVAQEIEAGNAPERSSGAPSTSDAMPHNSIKALNRRNEVALPEADSSRTDVLEGSLQGAAVDPVAEAAREHTHEQSGPEPLPEVDSQAESLQLAEKARLQAELTARKRAALEEEAALALAAQRLLQAELVREQELETMLELLASTKERRALQQAWSTWRAAAVRARAPLQRAMLILQWRRMTFVWRAWKDDVQRTKEGRAKERLEAELRADAAQQERVFDHWRLRLLSQCFILWQDFASKERLRKEVQAQHAARSHKMKALLSKQEALRLSLLWKDRKYRAGEVDDQDRETGPEDARGIDPGVEAEKNLDGHVDQAAVVEDSFRVHIANVDDLLGQEASHVTSAETDPVGDVIRDISADESPRGLSETHMKMHQQSGEASSTNRGNAWAIQVEAYTSDLRNPHKHNAGSLHVPSAQRERLHSDQSRPVQMAPQEEERDSGSLSSSAANQMPVDMDSQVSDRTKGAKDQGREEGLLLASDPTNKMEARAATRLLRREELRRKYEEVQKRKQEELEAAERLRLEAERLERAAALARRAEDARHKKHAEQAAARQRELAAQQGALAKIHYARQILLHWGWRPWRSLLEHGRSRLLTSELHHTRSLHRATWLAWRSFVEDVQEERARLEEDQLAQARQHHEKCARADAWRWWRQLHKARVMRDRARMRRALLCLHEATSAAREEERAALEARAHLLVARAWRGWHACADEGRDVRLLKEVADGAKADRFANRSLLKRSLEQWIDGVELFKEEAEKARNEEAMWAKINGWLADHRKGKSASSEAGIGLRVSDASIL